MARIGNELKLSIRLLKDRMDIAVANRTDNCTGLSADYTKGYVDAMKKVRSLLDDIVYMLENPK